MLLTDCTHGYHEKTIHLATRYPKTINLKNNILNFLPIAVWLIIGTSLSALAATLLVVIVVYSFINGSDLMRINLDISRVFIGLFAGATEQGYEENWFKKFSTGEWF